MTGGRRFDCGFGRYGTAYRNQSSGNVSKGNVSKGEVTDAAA